VASIPIKGILHRSRKITPETRRFAAQLYWLAQPERACWILAIADHETNARNGDKEVKY
jgi:hypothetical protein